MKISNILQLTNVYKNNLSVKTKKEVNKVKKDDLNLSSKAIDFQTALNTINKTPDIREDKVNDIINKIKKGNYNISSEEIANKILSD